MTSLHRKVKVSPKFKVFKYTLVSMQEADLLNFHGSKTVGIYHVTYR